MNASKLIDKQIAKYPDWRGKIMSQLRRTIHQAEPKIVEEWKWGTGVYTFNKALVCAVGGFKDHVKLNFFKGAALKDKHKLLNAGLESKLNRAVDFSEGDPIKSAALKDLIREAVGKNK